jgi:hypothetical protein
MIAMPELTTLNISVAGVKRQIQLLLPAGVHSLTLKSMVEHSAATRQRTLSIWVLRLALKETATREVWTR